MSSGICSQKDDGQMGLPCLNKMELIFFCSNFGMCDPCQAGMNCLKVLRNLETDAKTVHTLHQASGTHVTSASGSHYCTYHPVQWPPCMTLHLRFLAQHP